MGANVSKGEDSSQDEAPERTLSQESGIETNRNTRLPDNYKDILKHADSQLDSSSTEKLYEQLYAGVFLNHRKKKYWIDDKSKHCFMVFARDLLITWAEDKRYWKWVNINETSDVSVETAELSNVCWLEINGRFQTSMLSQGITYKVAFVVMLKDPAYGWEAPVNVRLTLPDKTVKEHKENLMEKAHGQWIEILVGEFHNEEAGEIEFSLYEYEGGDWKRGLLVKGAVIRPTTNTA